MRITASGFGNPFNQGVFEQGAPLKKSKRLKLRVYKISDVEILRMREMYEREGASPDKIRDAFAHHELTKMQIHQILQYQTRMKLILPRK